MTRLHVGQALWSLGLSGCRRMLVIARVVAIAARRVGYVFSVLLFAKVPPLRYIAIEINSACNRKCRWCPNYKHARAKDGYLDGRLIRKIIREAADMGFTGGVTFNMYNEPLLDRRLPAIIKYTREHLPSSYIYLNTNGDYLTPELWSKLRANGLDYANVSQYDGKMSDNIQRLLSEIDEKERRRLYAHVFCVGAINNRGGLVGSKGKVPLRKYCSRPFEQLSVTYEGKVVICCNDYLAQVVIGDIAKDSIKDLWESDVFRRYRRELLAGRRARLDLCKSCDA